MYLCLAVKCIEDKIGEINPPCVVNIYNKCSRNVQLGLHGIHNINTIFIPFEVHYDKVHHMINILKMIMMKLPKRLIGMTAFLVVIKMLKVYQRTLMN